MRTVFITGASDGIGRALVDAYLRQGWNVIAQGRRPRNAIDPALPASVRYLQHDLTAGLPDLTVLPDRLDLAILNAGFGKVATPADHSTSELADMVAVNITAPLLLAQALMPRLEAANGHLTLIGSTAAKGRHADFAPYAATKAALAGAARSLRLEWQDRVFVQIIHPGPTATAMHDKAGLGDIPIRKLFTAPETVAHVIQTAIGNKLPKLSLGPGFMLRHALMARVWSR